MPPPARPLARSCSPVLTLSGNEVRVVAVALNAAVLMLSGKCSDLFADVDSELRSSLSKHFFVLNKLDRVFQDFLARSGF